MVTFVAFVVVLLAALWLAIRRRSSGVRGVIRGNGRFQLEAVGESHYQPALRAIVGKGEVEHECEAELVLEDDNPHSNQAVRIDVQGKTVAYLNHDNARKYRKQIARYGRTRMFCAAKIFGGGKGRSLGIWLDVDGMR